MADYKEMYYTLFHSITDAIILLQKAQRVAEEMYIDAEEPFLDKKGEEKTKAKFTLRSDCMDYKES